jgi:hypothetical protein
MDVQVWKTWNDDDDDDDDDDGWWWWWCGHQLGLESIRENIKALATDSMGY